MGDGAAQIRRSDARTAAGVLAAIVLFPIVFVTGELGSFDFFWKMAALGASLVLFSAWADPSWRSELSRDLASSLPRKAAAGLSAAVVLYGVFFAGNAASRALFDFAAPGIDDVYAFKSGASTMRTALLIGLVIGPAEELFWRAFLQRRLSSSFGDGFGLATATALYAGVHIASGNPMLVLAALVCGTFWGVLYLARRSAVLNVVSHTAWDLAVFLIFPFGS